MSRDGDVRTLVIGLDAACATVFDRLPEGTVPTLRSVFETGVQGPLTSQLPPWTPSAWPSMYTGMNPGKHGIFDFLTFEGYDWDVVNATHCRERPLWELLDRHGYRSVVVNAPVTHPPSAFDGALVPGYMAPESPECHPPGLFAELEDAIGPYPIYPADGKDGKAYESTVAARGAAFRYLADRFDPDFGFLQFQATDTVFHDRPDDWETIERIYAAVDSEVEQVLDRCDPDTVFVVSDHGMGPLSGVEFRVNDWLAERGDVRTVSGGEGMPAWSTVRDNELKGDRASADTGPMRVWHELAGYGDGALRGLAGAAARAGVTSQRVGDALARIGLRDAVAEAVPASVVRQGAEQVDFRNSTAYVRSRTECGIRLNLAGREPDGVVPASDYDTVRADLIEALREVRTPDGDRLFEAVLPREAVFHGPKTEGAVDVVTVPNGFEHFLSATIRGSPFGPPTEPWNHKMAGIVAARGEGIDTDASLAGATLFDVAPTVLSTFGVPADERMDGGCLPVVESAGRRAYPDPQRAAPAETDDAAVEQRLSDLGYLE
jgi:predicted AlkP superfamily phosphohydrolase/phosphomutase